MKARRLLGAAIATALSLSLGVPALAATDPSLFDYKITDGGTIEIERYRGEGLASIEVPDTIDGRQVTEIDGDAFVKEVATPGDITDLIRDDIQTVTIPDSVTDIGEYAFYMNAGLTSVRLPPNLDSIDDGLFCACTALPSIDIPDAVVEIGDEAFCGCEAFTAISIPASVRSIGGSAFAACHALAEVRLPAGLTEIAEQTFLECTGLQAIAVPEGVETIGPEAFQGCTALKSITLPSSVRTIEQGAFSNCPALKNVTYLGTLSQYQQISIAGTAQDCALLAPDVNVSVWPLPEQTATPEPVPTPTPEDPGTMLPSGATLSPDAVIRLSRSGDAAYIRGYTATTAPLCPTVDDLEDQFQLTEGLEDDVYSATGTKKDDDQKIGTGDVYRITSGAQPVFEATVIVAGDVLGSGAMTLSQLVRMASAYRGIAPLAGPYLMAADLNGNGNVDLSDLVQEAALFRENA